MKPGDLIARVYESDGVTALRREELLSSVTGDYVPIGGIHLLISYVDGILTWLPLGANCNELFSADENDTEAGIAGDDVIYVHVSLT